MAKKNEAKIKFTADTKELNQQIGKSESELKEFRSELKLNSAQMKTTGDNTKTLQERQKILAQELESAKSKTEALGQKLEKASEIFGENSQEASRLRKELNDAKTVEEKIQAEINDTNEQLKKQKAAFDEVADKAEKAGEKLTNAGKSMSKVSAGIAAVGAASIAAFNEVDEGADVAIRATGATGEAAAELEASYKNVAGTIVGDFEDIGGALGEVNTRLGFTGADLETASTKFLEFANVTGMDAVTAVQKVSRYMGDAGIDAKEYESVLDNLTVAAQASGVSMDTLTENLTKYGAPMRALGFDTKESIAIFSSWEKAGVNTEIAFSGMKKAIGTWSKEGKDSRVEFKKTLDEIANCPDIASATTKAIEVFGQKAGPDLADAIQGGRFEYEDMLKVIEGSKGALSGTFDETVDGGYEMKLAMQNAKVALGEVGATLSTTLAPIVDTATEKLKGFAGWWKGLNTNTQKTIITIAGVVAAIGPVLIVMGSVASAISKISNAMKLAKGAITVVKTAMSGLNLTFLSSPIFWVIAAIVALVAAFVILWKKCDWFRNFWINLWQKIKSSFSTAWNGIKNAWSKAGEWFSSIGTRIKNVFAGFKDKLIAPFTKARDKIKGIADKIKGFFKGNISMPKIKLPHFSVSPKGWKVGDLLKGSIPKLGIQWYAKGGILTRPTIFGMNGNNAMVGGERGAEAILPIDTLEGYIANAMEKNRQLLDIQTLTDKLEDLANRPIKIGINGREFALATAGDYDNVNGVRSTFKSRGLET